MVLASWAPLSKYKVSRLDELGFSLSSSMSVAIQEQACGCGAVMCDVVLIVGEVGLGSSNWLQSCSSFFLFLFLFLDGVEEFRLVATSACA